MSYQSEESMKIGAFRYVTPCSLIEGFLQHAPSMRKRISLLPWRWRQKICPTRWCFHIKLHGVSSHFLLLWGSETS